MTHVELIQPHEKIDPALGGTGYLPPSTPATVAELSAALRKGYVIWKVARNSVNWRRPADTRLLNLGEARVRCSIVGGTSKWWFVMVLQDDL